MARLEDFQNRETQGIESKDAAFLSQSVQNLFETKSGPGAQKALPELLDFGTGPDLYLSAAYTVGSRSSAGAFMVDESANKPDVPKVQFPSDALRRPDAIRTKEDEAIWA